MADPAQFLLAIARRPPAGGSTLKSAEGSRTALLTPDGTSPPTASPVRPEPTVLLYAHDAASLDEAAWHSPAPS